MDCDGPERRKEPRYVIHAGAAVEVCHDGWTSKATTVDISGSGVLMEFAEPVSLAVGCEVFCQFSVSYANEQVLPYWGVGTVVRVDDRQAAVEFSAAGLTPLNNGTKSRGR